MSPAREGDPLDCVALMLVDGERLLVERRKASKRVMPGALAIPGGHVEPGETHAQALRREAREELAIELRDIRFVCRHLHAAQELRALHYFVATSWRGEISCREAESLAWVPLAASDRLDLEVDRRAVQAYMGAGRRPRPGGAPPHLAIFDCDGVLVDSEPIANRVLAESLTALGLRMTTEDCLARFKGQHFDQIIATVEDQLGRSLGESWLPELRRRDAEAFRRELQPVAGVHDALDRLAAAGIATCVASQGPFEKMDVSLGVTGLLARFEGRIFSAYQVPRGKPHPDLFLHAARSLQVPPQDCVVIEDSALGARAGAAAGMAVLGYAPDGDAGPLLAEGATVFGEMAALPDLLGVG